MNANLKLYGTIAMLIVLVIIGVLVNHWDNGRLTARFEAGKMNERAIWVTAQADANTKAQARTDANTLASEAVADQARNTADTVTSASKAANHSTVEKISYAYITAPPLPCTPGPLPAGVLEGLAEARFAALGGAVAATGGLQPGSRSGPADAPAD